MHVYRLSEPIDDFDGLTPLNEWLDGDADRLAWALRAVLALTEAALTVGWKGDMRHLPMVGHLPTSPFVTRYLTLANFALFDLVGLQLSPRIRDLGKITLYRTGPRAGFLARYPAAGPLLTRRLNSELITAMWDDLLRVAASVKGGHATAALVVGKLCSSKRQQNALTAAIKECGALRRTVYAARYLADETYRRRIARQLNKGENLHSLRRSLAYAGEGAQHHTTMSSRPSRCGA